MRTVVVTYKTTEEYAETNAARVRAVYEELRSKQLGGVRYSTYRLEAGQRFVHIASVESSEANPITALDSFKTFQEQLRPHCAEPVVVTEATIVGSYDSFGS
ncbi:MAG TPA: hypothetical protein VHB79_02765 [Polyangiaceae bacterium]|nr:hypothetical protein [Polyangiaceae bacterium]